jgi:outer membrane lipoprotein-sorting protein
MKAVMGKRILLALAIAAVARPDSLEDVLAHMDSAAKEFKSYSADVKMVDYTKIINETDETHGSMRLGRGKNGVSGIVDLTSGPDHHIYHFDGPKVEEFLPKAGETHVYNMHKSGASIDQFLLLGFSVTREELLRDYAVKLGSAEKVGSTDTTRVVLTPKSAETLKIVKTIELWIPDGKGNPIQEREDEPSGNYRLVTFSNLKLNPNLPPSAFELPPEAAHAKRIKMN